MLRSYHTGFVVSRVIFRYLLEIVKEPRIIGRPAIELLSKVDIRDGGWAAQEKFFEEVKVSAPASCVWEARLEREPAHRSLSQDVVILTGK